MWYDIIGTFSLSMNCCFVVAAVILLALQYVINNPIDEEKSEPSFIHIFVKVLSIAFFSAIIGLIVFNILYPKNYIDRSVRDDYDYIIVFGAGIKDGKTEIINSRLDNAITYAQFYKRCKFVLTGAKGAEEPIEEAVYMMNYMTARGIEDKRIIIDPYSINTEENIFNSLSLIRKDVMRRNARENIVTRPFKSDERIFDLDFLNIGFMSSEFHLTRINLMAHKFGIRKPYDIPCETNILYKPYLYVRENLSLLKAFVLGELKF